MPKKQVSKSVTSTISKSMQNARSLNIINRMKETERIEKENHAFAKRLFDKKAVLDKKQLDEEWRQYNKIKK